MEQKFDFKGNLIRTIVAPDEQIWFAGIDVCNVLGYADSYQKIKSLEIDEYRLDRIIDGQGKQKDTLTVNEFGLYSLILSSSKPEAKEFKRWVTHEVLPTIRKAGKYTPDEERLREEKLQTLAFEIEELISQREKQQKALNELKKSIEKKNDEMIKLIRQDFRQLIIPFDK